jgi:transcriptional regulator with XRE-family HTH domain
MKRLRADKDLTQKQLGLMLDCSPAAIAHWERGARVPSVDLLITVANIFDCSLEYIMGVSDFRHENEAIKYMLEKMVDTGLVDEDGYVKQNIVDRFIGYIKALEQIPMK